MAKINDQTTFPATAPAVGDHFPGTDISNTGNDANGETVTFTMQAVMDLFEANMTVPSSVSSAYRTSTILASTSNAEGAALIGVEDAGTYFAGATVEAVLAEIGALTPAEAGAEANPEVVPQATAEAGTSTTEYTWTPQRVAQAIAALSSQTSDARFAVYNDTGAQLDAGTPVYVSGYDATSGNPEVTTSDADASATMPCLGIISADLATATSGVAISRGVVSMDTSSFSPGAALYVSTSGTLTATPPSTGTAQIVAYVLVAAVSGSILAVCGEEWTPVTDGATQLDVNDNEVLGYGVVSSAVAYLQVKNAATGNDPELVGLGETNTGIKLTPSGTGNVTLGTLVFDADATLGAGQDNYVLVYDDASGTIGPEAQAGGGDVSKVGTPVDGQIGVWTGDGTIEGDASLTFDTTDDTLVIAASGKLGFGAVDILSDSAGTTTLQNIDAIDATTEATIEAAIDTLANLTSIQGNTVTLTGAFVRSGAHSLTLTTTGTTSVTFPTSGTLAVTGANTFSGAQDFGGNELRSYLNDVITLPGSGPDTLTAAGHSGNICITAGNVVIPTTAGFTCILIAGGAHTVTFNSTTSAAMAAGDIMTIAVESGTVIHAVLTAAADKVSFS